MKLPPALLLPLALSIRSSLALPSVLKARDLTLDTQNDLVNGVPCKKFTLIHAKGTTSPGNVGTETGPPFFQAVARLVGQENVAVQGVEYDADVIGFLRGGDPDGSEYMANLVEEVLSRCPDTKVTLSGWSQGAQLVHNAAELLKPETAAKVSSAITFGDPKNGEPFGQIPQSRTTIYCNDGDYICEGSIILTDAHSTYEQDATAAAQFVVQQAAL
ncbi:uncharacterized protein L3040_001496 [Drepanopeziza brunnea f. sp. 'multigermtubi']|uniref:cutinase n=1 Tax=Marssonina brunnea f. sp. multigermtubi (strain MB_m1) TaxID=1072389 RepID=K1X146_MARBU|nr:cutinase [Drepanopeziza brunnea f. sp. 'multigermtubi' MB_m1]EKD18956.1 cutinase [Drepanopeziza brunnea f. sp. 'multigermtubi' MB_m1]KAJ5051723.1 hypothetical protein L3040_001496 [Drepanopeziza brunnea f. sp. 'multigermtubi']